MRHGLNTGKLKPGLILVAHFNQRWVFRKLVFLFHHEEHEGKKEKEEKEEGPKTALHGFL